MEKMLAAWQGSAAQRTTASNRVHAIEKQINAELGGMKNPTHALSQIYSRLVMNAAARQRFIGLGEIRSGLPGGRDVFRAGFL
jgi:hypothetical protein